MTRTIGLIAPHWSINEILNLAQGYPEIELRPHSFDYLREIPGILDATKDTVSGWLLSGPLPFEIAKKHLGSETQIEFCRVTEVGLLRSVLGIAFENRSFLEDVSVDFVDEAADVDEILDDLGIPRKGVNILRYQLPVDEEEILAFHQKLLSNGGAKYAITTLPSVYTRLKSVGQKVYGVHASKMEIRLSLELLAEKVRSSYFKGSQTSFISISVEDYDLLRVQQSSTYGLQKLELDITGALLGYCEKIGGYLLSKGSGHYEIFGSRGSIERSFDELSKAVSTVELDIGANTVTGIGFGDTVQSAQRNSYRAVNVSKSSGRMAIMDDGGEITELAADQSRVSYASIGVNSQLQQKLKDAQISIRSYRKFRAVAEQSNSGHFSAVMLAQKLGVSDRNIRRILSSMAGAGLISQIGEESTGVSGRPAKIYKFVDKYA